MRNRCPICNAALVEAWGPIKSEILLLGEFPGKEEVREGRPWVGKAGEVLRNEFGRLGRSVDTMRSTNLWLHKPSKECDPNWHFDHAFKELAGKKAVLLIGSEVADLFLEVPISDCTGLRVKSKMLPKTVKVAVASYNPAQAMYGGLGEVRLAVERFVKLIEGIR